MFFTCEKAMALGRETQEEPHMIRVGVRRLFIQKEGWCPVNAHANQDMERTVYSANNMRRGIQNEESMEGLGE